MTLDGAYNGLHPRGYAKATFGGFHVLVHGVLTDAEQLANFPIALALRSQLQAVALARTQHGPRLECVLSRRLQVFVVTDRCVEVRGHHLDGAVGTLIDRARVRYDRAR